MTEEKKPTGEESQKPAAQAADQASANEADTPNPKKSSKGASKQDAPKAMTVAEIFAAMSTQSKQIGKLKSEIEEAEKRLGDMRSEKAELEAKLKPVRRMLKVFRPEGTVIVSLTPVERKESRLKIKLLKNQIILLEDKISNMKESFSSNHEDVAEQMRLNELRNKAQSKHWTKRNKWSVSARLVKALNLLRSEDLSAIRELAKQAKSKAEDNTKTFNDTLASLLDEHDNETAILCSHELRSSLYKAVRDTLQEWDSKKAPEFKKLVFSENK